MMQKKQNILEILEKQIDKIVLVLMIVISLGILWFYVLRAPYAESVDGRKHGPGSIDRYNLQRAEQLREKLDDRASYDIYEPVQVNAYDELMGCPFGDVEAVTLLPVPGEGSIMITEDRVYDIPEIGELTELAVANHRGAVQMPTEEVALDKPYMNAPTELADIDFVTVSASFDIQRLYTNFQQSFDAPGLKLSWRNPDYAKPIFAAMELQRRIKTKDGSWSEWERVPRTRIDKYRERFQSLPMTLNDSQFGINVWIPKFKDQQVQLDILQPEIYQYTVSRCNWMSPAYLQEAIDYLDEQKKQQQRELRDQRSREGGLADPTGRDARRQPRDTARRTTDRRSTRTGRTPDLLGLEDPAARRPVRTRDERDMQDILKDFQSVRLNETADLSKMRGSITVWAHDDTVQPGSTCQYRMRLGVFNPIAGKEWFRSDESQYQNQIVLWSPYSQPTDEIFIPKMIHVFPVAEIKPANGDDKPEGVELEVAKFYHGIWRLHAFEVYPGQLIGYELEDTPQQDERTRRAPQGEILDVQPLKAEMVDFSTGMMMVDLISEVSWGSSLRSSSIYQMVYYDKEGRIQQKPVNKRNWTKAVSDDYSAVQEAMDDQVQQTPGMGRPGGLEMIPPPRMDEFIIAPGGGL